MDDFGFVACLVLPQRRSPGVLGRVLSGNGWVIRGRFLPGVGQPVNVYCNYDGKRIVERYFGSTITWQIVPPEKQVRGGPPVVVSRSSNQ
jgi:hypothetical protein